MGSKKTLPPLPILPLELICPVVIEVLAMTLILPPLDPNVFRLPVVTKPPEDVRKIAPPLPEVKEASTLLTVRLPLLLLS
jgi:hypothetical protein